MKKSVVTLYTSPKDIYSYVVKVVLHEKGVNFETINVDPANPPTRLLELNPYSVVPTLVDRDLVLYEAFIIAEYLDERFPHPPLFPVYPIARAKLRLTAYHIEKDLMSLVKKIQQTTDDSDIENLRSDLKNRIIELTPVFDDQQYFLNEEFSFLDCLFGAILLHLPLLGIKLSKNTKEIKNYTKRLFEKNSFKNSLTEIEKECIDKIFG